LRGAAKAPALIRPHLIPAHGNAFAESGLDLTTPGVTFDAGDIPLNDDASDVATIEAAVYAHLTAGRRLLSLGGDHSITYPIVRGYARHFPSLSIVHFDAHPDLYPEFDGNPLSHACPFARILEETSVRELVQIGIRTMSAAQLEVAARHRVRVFGPAQLGEARGALPHGPVYVTIDLDGLDPAFAPGVSHREPGGLSVRDILETIAHIPGQVVGADVVEYNPDRDLSDLTAAVAGKLAKEAIARIHADA
jgi:agmatinase